MKNLSFLLVIIVLCCSSFNEAHTWELIHNEDGIKVYARSTSHSKSKETKVITTCNVPLSCLCKRLLDIDNYIDWFDTCTKSKLLKKTNDKEYYGYFIMQVPFPFQDRDLIAKINFTNLSSTNIQADIRAAANYLPKKRSYTRVPSFHSTWNAHAISANKTSIELHFHADMGGYLPTWALNSAAKWGPFMSVKKMRNLCL